MNETENGFHTHFILPISDLFVLGLLRIRRMYTARCAIIPTVIFIK